MNKPAPCCPDETWVAIPGWEGLYKISSCGRIWSIPRRGAAGGLFGTVRRGDSNAPGPILLNHMGRKESKRRAWLVLRTFAGEPTNGMRAHHDEFSPSDAHFKCLSWQTSGYIRRKAMAR